jgi:hypothetical protein
MTGEDDEREEEVLAKTKSCKFKRQHLSRDRVVKGVPSETQV